MTPPRTPRTSPLLAAAVATLLAALGLVVGSGTAQAGLLDGGLLGEPVADVGTAGPDFAAPGDADVTPGIQVFTAGAQCTANFVFADGETAYLGMAAHCAGLGAATDTNGCLAGSRPLGTPVELGDTGIVGELAYSSWLTMQAVGEDDPDACAYNDFALIELPAAAVARTNPSIPHWGGPTGLNTTGVGTLESVYSYGNSGLRGGLELLSPKQGVSLGTTGGGWTHPVYTATPGVPGDSGSAMLDAEGRATGVLSTLSIAPTPASNNFSDLALGLDYLRAQVPALAGVALVEGDVAFDPLALPIGL